MPIIQVQMLEGRSSDVKRQLISEVTEAVSRTLGNATETIRVILQEIPEENWGIGGVPIVDRKKS
ncbi:MAG: 2-hydroxymuconate tautomerase [Bacillota bacterium]|nr:2-hydroxymuconate tautomerase [Bacillota bacterium]